MSVWNQETPDFLGRASGLGPKLTEAKQQAKGSRRGLLGRVVESVRGVVLSGAIRVVEAIGGGTLLGQWAGSGDTDFIGYRPLNTRIDKITRDLDAWTYDKQIRMALYLYATNPMARWLIDNLVDTVLGNRLGFTFKLDAQALGMKDEEAEALQKEIYKHLETFWTHPAHSLDTRAREYATTQLVTGCLLVPVTVNEMDGVPMLDLIDAQQIAKVESADKSAIVPGRVWYRGVTSSGETKPLEVIRQRERQAALEGEAFYFPLRGLLNQLVGTSYLMDVIDWLDRHDAFMFAALDRAKLGNNYAIHVTMDGLSPKECIEHATNLKKQGFLNEPAAVVVTNEKGQLDAVSPNLQAGDTDTMARTFRTHILGSKSRPESWYSSGGETNRATAGEQTDVAYKALERWQDHFRGIFEAFLFFAYDRGKASQATGVRRSWPERTKGGVTITVNMPPIRERDYTRVGTALAAIEGALKAAVDDELLSQETAQTVFQTAASRLGADIDPTREAQKIEEERVAREERAAEIANQRAQEKLDGAVEDEPENGPPQPPTPGAPPKPEPEKEAAAA
jgi:hypothetical protein